MFFIISDSQGSIQVASGVTQSLMVLKQRLASELERGDDAVKVLGKYIHV